MSDEKTPENIMSAEEQFDQYGRLLNPNGAGVKDMILAAISGKKEEFHFYHISRDASEDRARSFEQGIKAAAGTGYGGQSSGFYCWTNEEQANKCFAGWAIGADAEWAKKTFGLDTTLKDGNALKVEITIPADAVKYPDFQLDNEQHPNKNRGRDRSIWLDFWEAQKHIFNDGNFTFKDSAGNSYKGISWDEEKHCPVLLMSDGVGNEKKKYMETTRAEDSELTQSVNDYFCRCNPEFRENYDALIKAVAKNEREVVINGRVLHTQNIALKYCGEAALENVKISKMHSNFGTDEKISGAKTVTYGEHKVSFNEEPLFFSNKALENKMAQLRQRVSGGNAATERAPQDNGLSSAAKLIWDKIKAKSNLPE